MITPEIEAEFSEEFNKLSLEDQVHTAIAMAFLSISTIDPEQRVDVVRVGMRLTQLVHALGLLTTFLKLPPEKLRPAMLMATIKLAASADTHQLRFKNLMDLFSESEK